MKHLLLSLTFLFFALPAVVMAQGSGSTAEPPTPRSSGVEDIATPFIVTRSVTAKIVEIDVEKGIFVVEHEGKLVNVKVDKKTRFKADKKSELGGRKSLSLADFFVGNTVKITFIPADGRIVEVRLRSETS